MPASGMWAGILKNLTMLGKWMTSRSTKRPQWISTLFKLSLRIFLFSLNFWLSLSVLLILTVFTRSLSVSGEEQNPRVPYSAISKNSMSIFKRSLEIMREKLSKMKSRYEEISVEGNKEMGNTREDSMWGTGEIKTSTVYANWVPQKVRERIGWGQHL